MFPIQVEAGGFDETALLLAIREPYPTSAETSETSETKEHLRPLYAGQPDRSMKKKKRREGLSDRSMKKEKSYAPALATRAEDLIQHPLSAGLSDRSMKKKQRYALALATPGGKEEMRYAHAGCMDVTPRLLTPTRRGGVKRGSLNAVFDMDDESDDDDEEEEEEEMPAPCLMTPPPTRRGGVSKKRGSASGQVSLSPTPQTKRRKITVFWTDEQVCE